MGGLEQQITEIKEAVELPLTHPELYEDIGIKPPKVCPLHCCCGARATRDHGAREQKQHHHALPVLTAAIIAPRAGGHKVHRWW